MRDRALAFAAAGALLVLATTAACDVTTGGCGDDLEDETVTYTGGTVEGGIYTSTSWEPEERLEFPPGLTIRFEHGLGAVPRSWQAYVSTAREGLGENLVLASGSEAELVAIDEQAIELKNGTCSDFFVVLVAQVGPAPAP